jgi:hypothetical protein
MRDPPAAWSVSLAGMRDSLRTFCVSLTDKYGRHSELPVMSHAHNELQMRQIPDVILMLGESDLANGCERPGDWV